ncbi:3'-5' exonuclease [Helicobacter suis]|uniref:3'-5' exonuclease n=1 Tax=Helicobacter suis TaxID=104628 RepID=UPI002491DBA8|nr:3'-5' exonuclease [Helicobacter suis]
MRLCVLDIETVPNLALIEQYYPGLCKNTQNPIEICQNVFAWHEEHYKSTFLPLHLHKIVSIASVIADEHGYFKKVGNFGKGCDDEKTLVADFFSFFNKHKPKIVTFNGRQFDMPLLLLKALAFKLSVPSFYEQEKKDNYKNYRYRYCETFHVDLLDSLGHFSGIRFKLDGICAMCGLPGKYDLSGDQVYEFYYQEPCDLKRIDSYCQSDVLNTYWLYLKYMLSRGDLSKENYLNILLDLKKNLPSEDYTPVFETALEAELQKEIQEKEDHV